MKKTTKQNPEAVEVLTHKEATRKNIPTAEYGPLLGEDHLTPIQRAYARRNVDLDPQLVWSGKDEQDKSDLVVQAPALYIHEKIHPKALIDDLFQHSSRESDRSKEEQRVSQSDLFADFNGIPSVKARAEFYRHDANWSNRLILGDSLHVMTSLAEREGLRGKVQCIYIDPPYGVNFNSNFQWSTTTRDVKDTNRNHITREPEQIRAFRDTWREGVHSYLSYLRDRLEIARDLLADTGSVFVQIGDENVHRVRVLMDEVFGESNFFSLISYRALNPLGSTGLSNVYDYIIWYAKDKSQMKYRNVQFDRRIEDEPEFTYRDDGTGFYEKLNRVTTTTKGVFKRSDLKSSGYTPTCMFDFEFQGKTVRNTGRKSWRTNRIGMQRLIKANRLINIGKSTYYRQHFNDDPLRHMENTWTDTAAGFSSVNPKIYVVQTHEKIVSRCVLMSTDPGDLVLDPTCGSGTTAYVAERWGRRWITIDTSRVSCTLARTRLMGARFPYYILRDSSAGRLIEARYADQVAYSTPPQGRVTLGFALTRVPKISLKTVSNNSEIDEIWDRHQESTESLRKRLNAVVSADFSEWNIPRVEESDWSDEAKRVHQEYWKMRRLRQQEIDTSISQKAEIEYLYDKPHVDDNKVRVSGPFTVECVSPFRTLVADNESGFYENRSTLQLRQSSSQDFTSLILENLQKSGVQQIQKKGRITFESLEAWPGRYICARGEYIQDDNGHEKVRSAGIMVGPEFGSVERPDLVAAARECADCNFDVLICCAFGFGSYASDITELGRIPVLKARMNSDLFMAEDLKTSRTGNLFVVFGEPDIDVFPSHGEDPSTGKVQVRINGVDVFDPRTGDVRSDDVDGIVCWFIDTNYNEESFFVRHAYFLGANDPYESLRRTLNTQINRDAWESLHSATSRPFDRPTTGRIAVKAINHFGDEVMKTFDTADVGHSRGTD